MPNEVIISIQQDTAQRILNRVNQWEAILINLPMDLLLNKRNLKNRTIKEITGHLIDLASNTHHKIVHLQYNTALIFPDLSAHNDTWVACQQYQDANWENLVSLWKFYNIHLSHVMENVSTENLNNTWTNKEGEEITLQEIIESYLWHLNLHLYEIEAIIKE